MKVELIKTFRFEAAHTLPHAPPDHKCRNLHGHSYRVDIHAIGDVDPEAGWMMDFGKIKQVVAPILDELDHQLLNEIGGLENPTSELLCKYLWDRIAPSLPELSAITVWESDTSRCVCRGKQ